MKRRTVVLLGAVALLVLGGVVLWNARNRALAHSNAPPTIQYVVTQGMAFGGSYRLTNPTWQASGTAEGAGYQLTVSLSPSGTGTPCCCTYLPCVVSNQSTTTR